ncbi:MAG: hypothetical protein NC331_05080 [Lachnospiraceae bacterium]|nr:hypothetical protein [Lachnospiraceae bacterium]MCM1238739.1 hypothetical protein [Lachnospiraceae bacterium]
MGYNLFGYNFMNAGGYDPYGMNMTNSLYMMNFYEQLKKYYAGNADKAAGSGGSTAAGQGISGVSSTDFQTAFQEAFRKALQESMGIADSAQTASQTESGAGKTASGTGSDRSVSAQRVYQTMNSYCSHPSHIWTSNFVRS